MSNRIIYIDGERAELCLVTGRGDAEPVTDEQLAYLGYFRAPPPAAPARPEASTERCPTCGSQGRGGPRLCADRWHVPTPPIESVTTAPSEPAGNTGQEPECTHAFGPVFCWVCGADNPDAR